MRVYVCTCVSTCVHVCVPACPRVFGCLYHAARVPPNRSCNVSGVMLCTGGAACKISVTCKQALHCAGDGCSFKYVKVLNLPAPLHTPVRVSWDVTDPRGVRHLRIRVDGKQFHQPTGQFTCQNCLEALDIGYLPQDHWQEMALVSHLSVSPSSSQPGDEKAIHFWQPLSPTEPTKQLRTIVIALLPYQQVDYTCDRPFYKQARRAIDGILSRLDAGDYVYISSPMARVMMQLPLPVPLVRSLLQEAGKGTRMLCDPSLKAQPKAQFTHTNDQLTMQLQFYFLKPILEACRARSGTDHVVFLTEDFQRYRHENHPSPWEARSREVWAKALRRSLEHFQQHLNTELVVFYFDYHIPHNRGNAEYFEDVVLQHSSSIPGFVVPQDEADAHACVSGVIDYVISNTPIVVRHSSESGPAASTSVHYHEPYFTSLQDDTALHGETGPYFTSLQNDTLLDGENSTHQQTGSVFCSTMEASVQASMPPTDYSSLLCLVKEYNMMTSLLGSIGTGKSLCETGSLEKPSLRVQAEPREDPKRARRLAEDPIEELQRANTTMRLNRLMQYSTFQDWASCLYDQSSISSTPSRSGASDGRLYDILASLLVHNFTEASATFHEVLCRYTLNILIARDFPLQRGCTDYNRNWLRNGNATQMCQAQQIHAFWAHDAYSTAGASDPGAPKWLMSPPNDHLIQCVESVLSLPPMPDAADLYATARQAFMNVTDIDFTYYAQFGNDKKKNKDVYETTITHHSSKLTNIFYPHLKQCQADPLLFTLKLHKESPDIHAYRGRTFSAPHLYCPNFCRLDAVHQLSAPAFTRRVGDRPSPAPSSSCRPVSGMALLAACALGVLSGLA